MTAQGIKQRTTSKTADRRHEQILDIVMELVQEQGYATEKQILSHMDGNRNRNDIQYEVVCQFLVRYRLKHSLE